MGICRKVSAVPAGGVDLAEILYRCWLQLGAPKPQKHPQRLQSARRK
jgi:hypothetical protein